MKRITKGILIASLAALVILYASPFAIRFESPDTRSIVLKHLVYYLISSNLDSDSEDSTAIALWRFTSVILRNPYPGEKPKDQPPMKILQAGWGSCDQQALVLINIARAHGLDGRLVFLFGEDSISHHSVAEIKTYNTYSMYDPYYGIILRDKQNNILSVEEIKNSNLSHKIFSSETKKTSFDSLSYRRLFGKKYPQIVKSENKIGLRNQIWFSLVKLSSAVYGKLFYDLWLSRQCAQQGECYNLNNYRHY